MTDLPLAVAPKWALAGGLPAPDEGEGFRSYVTRLGLDPDRFLLGLEGRTLENANARLASHLAVALPESFGRGVAALWIRQGMRPPEKPPPLPEKPFEIDGQREFHEFIAADLRRVLTEV
jgi:hypothetical protein